MVPVLCQVCLVVTALLAGCPARVILEAGGGGGSGGGGGGGSGVGGGGGVSHHLGLDRPELRRVLVLLPAPLAEPRPRPYSGYSRAQLPLQKRNMFGRII